MQYRFLDLSIIFLISLLISGCNLFKLLKYSKQEKVVLNTGIKHFKFTDNQIIFETTFSDGGKRDFLLDLGSPSNIVFIDTSISEIISTQKPVHSLSKVVSADGIKQKQSYYRFGTIKTNEFVLENGFLLALKRPDPTACLKIDGIWGASLFAPDFKGDGNKVLRISMQDSTINILDTLPPIVDWIPLEATFNTLSHIIIKMNLGGEIVNFYFDTGFSGSMAITSSLYETIKSNSKEILFKDEKTVYGFITNTLTGTQYDTAYKNVFTLRLTNELITDSVDVLSTRNLTVNVLGMEFIRRFNVIVDYQNKHVYIQNNPGFKHQNESFYKIKGFNAKNINDGEISILSIEIDSQAEKAGLKVGDQILVLNNFKSEGWNNCNMVRQIGEIDGNTINNDVVIKRMGEIIKITL